MDYAREYPEEQSFNLLLFKDLIEQCVNLTQLAIQQSHVIVDDLLDDFQTNGFRNLSLLDLHKSRISRRLFDILFGNCVDLKSLTINLHGFKEPTKRHSSKEQIIKSLTPFKQLTKLDVSSTEKLYFDITQETVCEVIRNNPNLSHINVSEQPGLNEALITCIARQGIY